MNQTSAQSTPAGHAMELVPPDQATLVEFAELHQKLVEICRRHTAEDEATIIADKIVLAEKMHIPTHGLHYFLHSILPHVQAGRVNDAPLRESGQIVVSEGVGGVGFGNLHRCLARASEIARDTGISLVVLKMPGKVGALRVFCHDLMDRGQLVMMVKNTARTVGLPETGQPSFGTNPYGWRATACPERRSCC